MAQMQIAKRIYAHGIVVSCLQLDSDTVKHKQGYDHKTICSNYKGEG